MKKVIVLLADGFEEVEAVTPMDYLCRAGAEVTSAAIGADLQVTGAWAGVKICADELLSKIDISSDKWDAVVVPGGLRGAENIASSGEAAALLKAMSKAGKLVCAICASPALVLAPLGLLNGKRFTCYPGMEERVKDGKRTEDRVAVDGNIITSRSAGSAGEFSIAIINALLGSDIAKKISDTVLL